MVAVHAQYNSQPTYPRRPFGDRRHGDPFPSKHGHQMGQRHLPRHEAVLIRSGFGLLLTLLSAHLKGGLAILKTRRLGLHVSRGSFIVFCNGTYFVALATMPPAKAMALFFVATCSSPRCRDRFSPNGSVGGAG